MYLEHRIFLQAFILEKFLFDIICLICLHREVSEMGLQFFENLSMSYYVIAIHDMLALFLKCLILIIN